MPRHTFNRRRYALQRLQTDWIRH